MVASFSTQSLIIYFYPDKDKLLVVFCQFILRKAKVR